MPARSFCQARRKDQSQCQVCIGASFQAVAPSCTACPSGWFASCLIRVDTAANHLSCTKCPLGWTSGNESASCVIDDGKRPTLIRFTGLRRCRENIPTMTMEWEYTPGEA